MSATTSLPEFDEWWDYDHADETERRFRELLPRARSAGDPGYLAELLTQIARTEGLQRKFTDAHSTLDEAEMTLVPEMKRARVRYLLERGRVFNSSGDRKRARPLFLDAWRMGKSAHEEALAVDAAHMMGIVEPPEKQMQWNLKALAMAERSSDPKALRWRGSLLNNIGWTFHDSKRYDEALETFRKALECRLEQQQPGPIRIARWCIARTLRSLGRVEDALDAQTKLEEEGRSTGDSNMYIHEELAECLHALGREDEARPWFERAYEAFSKDVWVAANEPERIQRLKLLADVA